MLLYVTFLFVAYKLHKQYKPEFRNFVELLRDIRLGRTPQYSPIKSKHVHKLLQLMRVMSSNREYEELWNESSPNLINLKEMTLL